jgi:histidine phosphotransferase ChpT
MTIQQSFVPTDLASLIGSRICHDLISPIGAINNGLELLVMSGDAAGPEMGLIGESVESASARIRFFRIAFGSAGEQMVGVGEVNAILRDLYATSRLDLRWTVEGAQSRGMVRTGFLALMCLETAMPYGGTVEFCEEKDGWLIKGQADRINAQPALWGWLAGEVSFEPLQPAHVQFALLPLVAKEHGRRLITRIEDGQIEIRI